MSRKSSAGTILEHAQQMFAQYGYAGTIMDELADSAKVNKATIYYHFKDKEHLYEEVLVRHFEALATAVVESSQEEESADVRFSKYIETFAKESYERKDLTAILMREIAGGGDKMPNRAKAQMHKILMHIKSILEAGVREESFAPADVLSVHFMVIGTLSFYITSEPMRLNMVSADRSIQKAFASSDVSDIANSLCMMIKDALLKPKIKE